MTMHKVDWALSRTGIGAPAKLLLVGLAWITDADGVTLRPQLYIAERVGKTDIKEPDRWVREHLSTLAGEGMLTRYRRRRGNGSMTTDLIILNLPRTTKVDLSVYSGTVGEKEPGDREPTGGKPPVVEKFGGEPVTSSVHRGETPGGPQVDFRPSHRGISTGLTMGPLPTTPQAEGEGPASELPIDPGPSPSELFGDKRLVETLEILRTAPRLVFDPEYQGVANMLLGHPKVDHRKAAHVAVAKASNPTWSTTDAGMALFYAIQVVEREAARGSRGAGRRPTTPSPASTGPSPDKPWAGTLARGLRDLDEREAAERERREAS